MTPHNFRSFFIRHRGKSATAVVVLLLFLGVTVYAQSPSGADAVHRLTLHESTVTEPSVTTAGTTPSSQITTATSTSESTHASTAVITTETASVISEQTTSEAMQTTTACAVVTKKPTTAVTKSTSATATASPTIKAITAAPTTKATAATTVPAPTLPLDYTTYDPATMSQKVLELVNQARKNAGLSQLTSSASLVDTAAVRGPEIMILWSHTRPDGSSCFTAFSADWSYMGENIAEGQRSAQRVMDDWMASEYHRENILSPNFSQIGIYCGTAADGTYYWVQEFGG